MEYAKDSKERVPYEHYLEVYRQAEPLEMSRRTEIPYSEEEKVFFVDFFGDSYRVSYPEFEISHQGEEEKFYPLEQIHSAKILIVRFLTEGVLSQSTGKFFTYREMPWGEVYYRQFQGRCLMRLAFGFGSKLEQFQKAMESLGARKLSQGDSAYEVELLKGFYMQLILWEGDEEFPPSAQILFSDNFAVSFSAEDRVVAGDIVIGTLKACH